MRAKIIQLHLVGLSVGRAQRDGDLSVANVEGVEKGLVMKERRIVDVE